MAADDSDVLGVNGITDDLGSFLRILDIYLWQCNHGIRNLRPQKLSLPGTFVPGNLDESSMELSSPGFVP